ncbi:MAG: hypothetical protein KGH93_02460 [Patescibacteria group bacterium]|nr:hypothetical protein [Patescibacteria group bacterium]
MTNVTARIKHRDFNPYGNLIAIKIFLVDYPIFFQDILRDQTILHGVDFATHRSETLDMLMALSEMVVDLLTAADNNRDGVSTRELLNPISNSKLSDKVAGNLHQDIRFRHETTSL